ncbi:MAG: restriction endonuclease subunit S [Blastocatellia bacterium]|nr:restriction endonuclease subunit S [Blastocatellia bacterium]
MIQGDWHTIGEMIKAGVAILQTGPFGTMLSASEYTESGTPVIAVQDIGENQLRHDKFVFVPDEVAERLSRYRVKKNDIIFGRKGAVERRALIKNNEDGWLQGSDCIRLRLDDSIDPRFVAYQLGDNYHRNWLQQFATGATMPSLNQEVLKMLPLFLPELPKQKAIAEVLSSLDDKIDLLHRQNKTLESLAQTLFRQWFIEEADDSWEEKSLFDVIELVGGGTPKTNVAEYWNGDIKWISAKDITPNNKRFIVNTEKMISDKGLSNCSARLLPKFSTVISARGTVGNYCLLSDEMTFSQSNYGVKPSYKDCFFFTYLLIGHSVAELQSAAYGSVFDTITTNTFKEHKIKLPLESEIRDFETSVSPYFRKMLSNQEQMGSLTKVRDSLLPKLMSGEVSVNAL